MSLVSWELLQEAKRGWMKKQLTEIIYFREGVIRVRRMGVNALATKLMHYRKIFIK